MATVMSWRVLLPLTLTILVSVGKGSYFYTLFPPGVVDPMSDIHSHIKLNFNVLSCAHSLPPCAKYAVSDGSTTDAFHMTLLYWNTGAHNKSLEDEMKEKAVKAFTRLDVTLDISSLGTFSLPEKAVVKFNVKEVGKSPVLPQIVEALNSTLNDLCPDIYHPTTLPFSPHVTLLQLYGTIQQWMDTHGINRDELAASLAEFGNRQLKLRPIPSFELSQILLKWEGTVIPVFWRAHTTFDSVHIDPSFAVSNNQQIELPSPDE